MALSPGKVIQRYELVSMTPRGDAHARRTFAAEQ
jgi:hypothetical protein